MTPSTPISTAAALMASCVRALPLELRNRRIIVHTPNGNGDARRAAHPDPDLLAGRLRDHNAGCTRMYGASRA
jgi:hypothetical protein